MVLRLDHTNHAASSLKSGKHSPKTPLIHPVSYPKKIPPKAANAHIKYALTVTGASIREVSAVPVMTGSPAIMLVVGGWLVSVQEFGSHKQARNAEDLSSLHGRKAGLNRTTPISQYEYTTLRGRDPAALPALAA